MLKVCLALSALIILIANGLLLYFHLTIHFPARWFVIGSSLTFVPLLLVLILFCHRYYRCCSRNQRVRQVLPLQDHKALQEIQVEIKQMRLLLSQNKNYEGEIPPESLCLGCLNKPRNVCGSPCGHLCLCDECVPKLQSRQCIICKQPVSWLKVIRS